VEWLVVLLRLEQVSALPLHAPAPVLELLRQLPPDRLVRRRKTLKKRTANRGKRANWLVSGQYILINRAATR